MKITDNGLTVITECLISGAKVQEGIDYKLSSRIGAGLATPPHFTYTVSVGVGETISLPMFNGDDSLYDFTVTFGDNTGIKTVMAYADTDRQHTYVSAGTFDISILGTFDRIIFDDSPNSIIEVKEFGPGKIGLSSFENCINFTTITAAVTTMARMFLSCAAFNQSVSSFNTTLVTLMNSMFQGCTNFNQSVSTFDTGAVTTFVNMFFSATSFNQNIGSLDITALTQADNMFDGVTLSTTNYDALLVGWEGQVEQTSVVFDGGNSLFTKSPSAAETARSVLIATSSWTIVDGGPTP